MASGQLHRTVRELLERPDRGGDRRVAGVLTVLILLHVAAIVAESVAPFRQRCGAALWTFELVSVLVFSVLVFSVKYALRFWVSAEAGVRLRQACTLPALFDPIAIPPFWPGTLIGADLRVLRVLRPLRQSKPSRCFAPLKVLGDVLKAEAAATVAAAGLVVAPRGRSSCAVTTRNGCGRHEGAAVIPPSTRCGPGPAICSSSSPGSSASWAPTGRARRALALSVGAFSRRRPPVPPDARTGAARMPPTAARSSREGAVDGRAALDRHAPQRTRPRSPMASTALPA